jgi:hypothetical protein
MATEAAQRERALKLAERLAEIGPEADEALIQRLINRLKMPMSKVLAKVPGDSIPEKCKRIGISRQNYYAWVKGLYRPSERQAKRLEALTGYAADRITGKAD